MRGTEIPFNRNLQHKKYLVLWHIPALQQRTPLSGIFFMKSEPEEKTENSDNTGRGENGQSCTGNKTQNQGQTDEAGDNNKTSSSNQPGTQA